MSMVEAKFHLLQIREKMAAPDSIIAPQLCFGERPETLNAVDVISLSRELPPAMVNPVMPVTVGEKTVVGTERVGIDRASFGDFLLDNEAEHSPRDIGNRACVDPAVSLEKPENSDFSGRTPAAVAFAASTEIGLVNFDFSCQGSLALACSDDGTANEVVDTFRAMPVDAKLTRGADRGDLQREETDKLPNFSVREPTALNDFVNHRSSIRKVKHLY